MNILYDANIPHVEELFASYGNLYAFKSEGELKAQLKNSDVLLIRTVQTVDQQMLQDSCVKFVGSMTIGDDHVDRDFLRKGRISFANAPGCNAQGVVDYVVASLFSVFREPTAIKKLDFAIVGYGNIGKALHKRLQGLVNSLVVVDPLLDAEKYPEAKFVTLHEASANHVISFHVPLIRQGENQTEYLVNEVFLNGCRSDALIINTARGAVVNNRHLKKHLGANSKFKAVLDVWENEPDIDVELMRLCQLATPHIAGYTVNGKRNASLQVLKAFCEWSGNEVPEKVQQKCQLRESVQGDNILSALTEVFDVEGLNNKFKTVMADKHEPGFSGIRNTYALRKEFSDFKIDKQTGSTKESKDEVSRVLELAGFSTS